MTSDYTPTLSDYKEAVVLSVSEETKTVKISYTEATLQREKEKGLVTASRSSFLLILYLLLLSETSPSVGQLLFP